MVNFFLACEIDGLYHFILHIVFFLKAPLVVEALETLIFLLVNIIFKRARQ